MTEFSVRLANSPGQLATLARTLADAEVGIEAFATIADMGRSHVRFIADNDARARRVLQLAGVEFDETDVLDTFIPRGTSGLAAMAEGLARAGVNIDSMYLLHTDAQGYHIAVTVSDPDLARAALAV
ncbi:MAG: hypothetical protein DWP92_10320 [Armatimonadetes bacterium]|nr:MAG: hypothetical protein DWP92_10320 [Armatimonadota bacterium]